MDALSHTPATGVEDEIDHRANQVDARHIPQQQVERRESQEPIKCMRSPHPATVGEGERG